MLGNVVNPLIAPIPGSLLSSSNYKGPAYGSNTTVKEFVPYRYDHVHKIPFHKHINMNIQFVWFPNL